MIAVMVMIGYLAVSMCMFVSHLAAQLSQASESDPQAEENQ
jgi:hypothetical protein